MPIFSMVSSPTMFLRNSIPSCPLKLPASFSSPFSPKTFTLTLSIMVSSLFSMLSDSLSYSWLATWFEWTIVGLLMLSSNIAWLSPRLFKACFIRFFSMLISSLNMERRMWSERSSSELSFFLSTSCAFWTIFRKEESYLTSTPGLTAVNAFLYNLSPNEFWKLIKSILLRHAYSLLYA